MITVPDSRLIPGLTHRQDLLALLTLALHLQAACGVVADLLAHCAVIFTFCKREGEKGGRMRHVAYWKDAHPTVFHTSAQRHGQGKVQLSCLSADMGFPCGSLRMFPRLSAGTACLLAISI